eukprot:scaffold43095_cov27-Tisochrysis_lutea.AAC.4
MAAASAPCGLLTLVDSVSVSAIHRSSLSQASARECRLRRSRVFAQTARILNVCAAVSQPNK